MLKYAITSACPKSCEYCIMRSVDRREERNLSKVRTVLELWRAHDNRIMLTGGEPTISSQFSAKYLIARELFDEVYLTTANVYAFTENLPWFDAITFSAHNLSDVELIPSLSLMTQTIYVSILAGQYRGYLPSFLHSMGFAGLTINEEQRAGEPFNKAIPRSSGFSIKINRKGYCMDETIILPDLEVIHDFRPYL